ncbi:MAG: AraC family transcriptional regulator [Arachidicoccus sp.]|nr:AraC family transcriptional regulator [Arachidicoccus sp.]
MTREVTLNELVNTISTRLEDHKNISTHLVVPQNYKEPFGAKIENGKPVNFALLKTKGRVSENIPYRFDHYAIVLCVAGTAKKTVGNYAFSVEPHSMHFIFPGMVNTFSDCSEDLELYIVLFKKEFFADMYIKDGVLESILDTNMDLPPHCNLHEEDFVLIKSLIDSMYLEYSKGELYCTQIIQSILIQLFYLSGRFLQNSAQKYPVHISRGHQLTQQLKKEIGKHFLTKRTVQEYADILFVTPKYLSEVIKTETGETPIKLIHQRVYHEALYLLTYTEMSIKEISEYLNFDTPSHFSRFFKQYAGYSPSALKRGA